MFFQEPESGWVVQVGELKLVMPDQGSRVESESGVSGDKIDHHDILDAALWYQGSLV